jgi:hypothetical protein
MHESPQDALLVALIDSVRSRSDVQTAALGASLQRRCWPGGTADRSEPAALPWVRRWGPAQLTPPPPECSCAVGRCHVCN